MDKQNLPSESFSTSNQAALPTLCRTEETRCPECGSPMSEVDRRRENGTMYLWFECVDPACAYQWLDHFSCW